MPNYIYATITVHNDNLEKQVEEFTYIGNWVKSCKTLEQLNTVENFLNTKIKFLAKQNFSRKDISALNYHLGVLDGTIMSIKGNYQQSLQKVRLDFL